MRRGPALQPRGRHRPAARPALAQGAGEDPPSRRDEPYRRALSGIYARLAASAEALTGRHAALAPSAQRPGYAGAEALSADLDTIADALGVPPADAAPAAAVAAAAS